MKLHELNPGRFIDLQRTVVGIEDNQALERDT
jgi:hypothetical protein